MRNALFLLLVLAPATTLADTAVNSNDDASRFLSEDAHRENIARQLAMTPETIAQLREYGITDESSLALEYFFYAGSAENSAQLSRALAELEYAVEHGPSAADEHVFIVAGWTTPMTMDEATVVEWTRRMCDLGFEHDAEFDGWGTDPAQGQE